MTPARKRIKPDPGVISPRTETRYFRLSHDDPLGASEPLGPDDSPDQAKFKKWFQREVFVSTSDEENARHIPSPKANAAQSSSSWENPADMHDQETAAPRLTKQFKWGSCPRHGCARSPHVFGSECAPKRRGKAFLCLVNKIIVSFKHMHIGQAL